MNKTIKRHIYIILLTTTLTISIVSISALFLMPQIFPYKVALELTNVKANPVATVIPFHAKTLPPSISASSVYLIDANSGTVLDNVNGNGVLPMASITKLMTSIIAIESGNLDKAIPVKQDAIDEVTQNNGSTANLVVGDSIPLKDMLYGLMLPSGDDAAIAIGDSVGGSQVKFVALMNQYAKRLGMTHTHFVNSDGLTYTNSDGKESLNTTSAADLIRLAQYAMRNPLLAQIVQTQNFIYYSNISNATYNWQNTNNLLNIMPGIIGVKTGSTDQAGYCLLFEATDGSKKLIGVILNDTSTDSMKRFYDAQSLLNWGFSND